MGCKCGDTKTAPRLIEPSAANSSPDYLLQFSRESCPRCTFKHLAYAYVALEEVDHGYPEHLVLAETALLEAGFGTGSRKVGIRKLLDAKARAVGHLVHAMEECPDKELGNKIREAYTSILDGDEAVDILSLIVDIDELQEKEAK